MTKLPELAPALTSAYTYLCAISEEDRGTVRAVMVYPPLTPAVVRNHTVHGADGSGPEPSSESTIFHEQPPSSDRHSFLPPESIRMSRLGSFGPTTNVRVKKSSSVEICHSGVRIVQLIVARAGPELTVCRESRTRKTDTTPVRRVRLRRS